MTHELVLLVGWAVMALLASLKAGLVPARPSAIWLVAIGVAVLPCLAAAFVVAMPVILGFCVGLFFKR